MKPLSVSEIMRDWFLLLANMQHGNLYGHEGNSNRWAVTEPEIWESSPKKYGKLDIARRFQVGTKHPGHPSVTAKILWSPAVFYNNIFIRRYAIHFHFSIISHTHFFLSLWFQSIFFMFRIFHKFFFRSLPFIFITLAKPQGKHIRWEWLSLPSC